MRKVSLMNIFMTHDGYVSDKWDHYIGIYEAELQNLLARNKPLRLLEIGVQNGGSLQIWNKYLPQGSQVVGIDIDEKCRGLHFEEGIQVLIGNATDKSFLDEHLVDTDFDIIIDDGSHQCGDVIASFNLLFPHLEPSGKYFIEDLHCSYLRVFSGGYRKAGSSIEWLKSLIDSLNCDYFDAEQIIAPLELSFLKSFNRQIRKVSFYDSVTVVEKYEGEKARKSRRIVTGEVAEVVNLDIIENYSIPGLDYVTVPGKGDDHRPYDDIPGDTAALQSRLRDMQDAINTTDRHLTRMTSKIDTMQSQLDQRDGEIARLTNDIAVITGTKLWRLAEKIRKPISFSKKFITRHNL